jgi:tetratricopeptide (TPR) repeat protein
VLDAIEEAMRSQLLGEEKVGGSIMYDFAHALIRETLYEGLSLRRRMRLHQQVGEALEAVYAHNLDAVIEDLAFHFTRSPQAEVDKAVGYALRAAEKAHRLHAHEEAVKFYSEAVDLLREAGRQGDVADVLERLGEPTYLATGDPRKAVTLLAEPLAHFESAGEQLRAAEIRLKMGRILQLSDQFAEGIPHLRRALEDFEREGTPQDVTRTLVELARAENFSGALKDAETHSRRARELAIAQGMRAEEAMATEELALVAMRGADLDEAVALHEQAIRLAETRAHPGDWLVLRRAHNNLGVIHQVRGDLEAAIASLERALAIGLEERNRPWIGRVRLSLGFFYLWRGDIARATGMYQHIADPAEHAEPDYAHGAAGLLLWLEGDWESAYASMQEDFERVQQTHDLQSQLGFLGALMRNAIDLGRFDDSTRWADEALSIYAAQGDFSINPAAVNSSAIVLAMAGRVEEARVLVERAAKFRAARKGAVFGIPYNAMARAVIAVAAGNPDDARAAHEESQMHFARMGMVVEAASGQFLLAHVMRSSADAMRSWARSLLQAARETFERIGFSRYVQEIDRLLAEAQA